MRSRSSSPRRTPLPTGRHPFAARSLLLPLALGLVGCRDSGSDLTTYEVKGRILLASGKPLTKGRVTFVAADGLKLPASGEVGADGTFSLTTREPGDGAVPGQFKVRIEPVGYTSRRGGRPAFPIKYIDEDSSGLAVTVRPEPNRLDPITLK